MSLDLAARPRSAELAPLPVFVETVPGILVAELADLPDDDTTIDLQRIVREAEEWLS
jgi:hypothetical protein